jgi:uncharacterized protein YjdB
MGVRVLFTLWIKPHLKIEMGILKIECDRSETRDIKLRLATFFGYKTRVEGDKTVYVAFPNDEEMNTFSIRYCVKKQVAVSFANSLNTYMLTPAAAAIDPAAVGRSWFKASELAAIYNFPSPSTTAKVVVGVISFGGGLVGTVDASGVLTGGDVQAYWSYLGISSANMPTVVVVPISGATNSPNPTDGATIENTLDVETIGGCCPTSNLTIILYIAPNSLAAFGTVFNYALNTAVTVKGVSVKPSILSVSWGAPEIYYNNLSTIDAIFATAVSRGINICTATGDNGSNDGVGGTGSYCDFPSSSPNVVAVGGTNLVCPNNTYDGSTVETAWSSGGGAISSVFTKPAYQSALSGTKRNIPDIASVADPSTGVVYLVGGSYVVYGGTSVAAPTFAAYLACAGVNTFVNPRLYAAGQSYFHDVLVGSNGAFVAKTGYDNCTGLGSVRGSTLLPVLLGNAAVTGVTLNASTTTVAVGRTYQSTATVAPSGATNKSVTWSSSNTGIATVNSTGLVTGVANGTATITVTTVDGSFTASLTVTVVTPVTSVSLNVGSLALTVAATSQLTATVLPAGAGNKGVTWTTSNASVATVVNGLVRAVANGTATITVTTVEGSFRATCAVTVTTRVTGVTLNRTAVSLKRGLNSQLTATVAPTTASNKAVTWLSSNTAIATVNSSGLVTGRAVGSCTITVRTTDGGFTATSAFTITP